MKTHTRDPRDKNSNVVSKDLPNTTDINQDDMNGRDEWPDLASHMKSHTKANEKGRTKEPEAKESVATSEYLPSAIIGMNQNGTTGSVETPPEVVQERESYILDGVWPKECFKCPSTFCGFPDAMAIHFTEHWKNGGQCPVCDRCFGRGKTFVTHIKTHMEAKALQCKVCDAKFPEDQANQEHHVAVSGKPYQCKVGDETFHCSGSYCAHMRSHQKNPSVKDILNHLKEMLDQEPEKEFDLHEFDEVFLF